MLAPFAKFTIALGARSEQVLPLHDLDRYAFGARSSFPATIFKVESPSLKEGTPKSEVIFVNGIMPTPAALLKGIRSIAQEITPDFTMIVNREEPGLFSSKSNSVIRALCNVARGLFSTQQGMLVEDAAVTALKETIQNACTLGKSVEVIAHSQGTLIASNALCLLAKDKVWWNEFKDQINVKSMGGVGFRWPDEARIELFEYKQDPVPKMGRIVYRILNGAKSLLSALRIINSSEEEKNSLCPDTFRIKLKSNHNNFGSHDVRAYTKKLHIFWQQGVKGLGHTSSMDVAEIAANQFNNHKYTPKYFTRLISDRFKNGDRAFLGEFIKQAKTTDEAYLPVLALAKRSLLRICPDSIET